MDLISERKLGRNIIKWYPMSSDSDVLQIGIIPKETIKELCAKTKSVTIIVENEEQKEKISSKVDKENLEIKVLNSLNTNLEKKYGFVTLIGTLENYNNLNEIKAYKRLGKIIRFAKDACKDNGKILLAVNNKYGMKSWTTLKADKNIICNQTYSLSKTLIDKILNDNDLVNRKYYYVLPDYKATNVIFTDEYLPNLESINRNFLYGEEEFENFNQTEAYVELLKENPKSFEFFANSYFVEIGKSEFKDNEIKFVSYTNIRKEKYKIQTIIYNDRVEKTYVDEDAKAHIENIIKNIDIMNKNNINTLDRYENSKIISRYVEDAQSYDKVLIQLLINGENEKFFEKIQQYKNNLLEKLEKIEFDNIKNDNIFTKYGVDYSEEMIKEMHFVKYGLWDLIFQNTFYINNELYFYDQEWFDYNVPIEFIIYRAIAYFPTAHSFINSGELYKRLGLERYIEIFQELDKMIQKEIRDDEIWKLHTSTRTGQTLLDLYKNLINEFENYKLTYNQEIINSERSIIEDKQKIIEDKQRIIEQLQQNVENLTNEKEKIYNSNSWKITKPMRWIGKNIKRKN